REALVRRWSNARLEKLVEQIRKPSPALLDQMAVAA
ncbi:transposase, partial [Rhodanobacter sp. C05]